MVKAAENTKFRHFVTGDESWFFYASPNSGLWLRPPDPAPEAQKSTHYAPKTMVTIFWNPTGALLVTALPVNETWDADYFIQHVLVKLQQTSAYKDAQRQGKKFTIHMDNARVHTARRVDRFMAENGFERAPHPPYSPDLAPSDFYLFGALKERIKGRQFESSEAIIEWITAEFEEIPLTELSAAFSNWKKRLNQCATGDGSYIR